MMIEVIHQYAYHKWATLKVIHHVGQLPEELYTQKIKSVFPSINDTFKHMVEVDEIWFSRLKGMEIANRQFLKREDLLVQYENLLTNFEDFLKGEEDFGRIIQYCNSGGEIFKNTVYELVQHVVNHGTYHRGNLSAMLRQINSQTVATDYIYFLREKES
ncbi:DinB family protein [Metabacillus bambusae]|uniref:DinB family protein n=1 Tax=Metabacillus bambusae TaxID=2795218 RepID=A0ABS3N8C8_9BACI|nr:DinB family protein [Metabacillus bambusae]MBO1514519.1 DinB family protein [Metabacillus bambusae]